ncbi:hypothetical protein DFH28DRAFT_980477 [Melampsora americana]|nr:hypothetical protein DFH28DRAFT_980477 [Melampsora americana]
MFLKCSPIIWFISLNFNTITPMSPNLLETNSLDALQKGTGIGHRPQRFQCPDLNETPEEYAHEFPPMQEGITNEVSDELRHIHQFDVRTQSQDKLIHSDQTPRILPNMEESFSGSNSDPRMPKLIEDSMSSVKGKSVHSQVSHSMGNEDLGFQKRLSNFQTSSGDIEFPLDEICISSYNQGTNKMQLHSGPSGQSSQAEQNTSHGIKRKPDSLLDGQRRREEILDVNSLRKEPLVTQGNSNAMQNAFSKPNTPTEARPERSRPQSLASSMKLILFAVHLGEQKIEENKAIFADMDTFWSEQKERLRISLRRIFPQTERASESVALWLGEQILFPSFIDRVNFIHSLNRVALKHSQLALTMESAKEYFKKWISEEVDDLKNHLDSLTDEEKVKLCLYDYRFHLYVTTGMTRLYSFEFGYQKASSLTSLPWAIIDGWLSKDVKGWKTGMPYGFSAFKPLYNKEIKQKFSLEEKGKMFELNEKLQYPNNIRLERKARNQVVNSKR